MGQLSAIKALFFRELLRLSRNPKFCVGKALFAWIFFTFLTGMALSMGNRAAGSGVWIFRGLVWVSVCMTGLMGVLLSADSVSSERREGTLGLLILTRLDFKGILLGKALSAFLAGFTVLLACTPVTSLVLIMGGVTRLEVLKVVLLLNASLVFSICLGILASTFHSSAKSALVCGVQLFITSYGIPILLELPADKFVKFMVARPFLSASQGFLEWISPLCAIQHVWVFVPGGTQSNAYSYSILTILTLSALALFAAVHVLKSQWKIHCLAAEIAIRKPLKKGGVGRRQAYSVASPYGELLSRECRMRTGQRIVLMAAFCILITCCFLSVTGWDYRFFFICAMFTAIAQHVYLKWTGGLAIAQRLAEDAVNGGLELILTTPIQLASLYSQVTKACAHGWLHWKYWLLAQNMILLFMSVCFKEKLHIGNSDSPFFYTFFGGGILLVWTDFRAISNLVLYFSIRREGVLKSAAKAFVIVVLVPWPVVVFGFMILGNAGASTSEMVVFLWSWYLGCVAVLHGISVWLKNRMITNGKEWLAGY